MSDPVFDKLNAFRKERGLKSLADGNYFPELEEDKEAMASKKSILAAREKAINDVHHAFDKEIADIRESSLKAESEARTRASEAVAAAHAEYNKAQPEATDDDTE